MIKARELAKAILRVANKHGENKAVEQAVSYLQQNNLSGLAPMVLRELQHLVDTNNKFVSLQITSRYSLTHKAIEAIVLSLEKVAPGAKDAPVVSTTSTDQVGGIVVTFQGQQFNASLDHQTNKLYEQLIDA